MGWSWSLHLCQPYVEHQVWRAAQCTNVVCDRAAPAVVHKHSDVLTATCVDNFAVGGIDKHRVNVDLQRIVAHFEK